MNMEKFDPSNPADAMADMIRVKTALLGLDIFNDHNFRSLTTVEQIETMTGGVLTALMGVLFSFIRNTPTGHDEIEMFVSSYITQARAHAEAIAASKAFHQ